MDRLSRLSTSNHAIAWLGPRLAEIVTQRLGAPAVFAHWGALGRPVFDVPPSHEARAAQLGILTVASVEASLPRAPIDRAIRQAPEHEELPPLTDRGTPPEECFDRNITEPPC